MCIVMSYSLVVGAGAASCISSAWLSKLSSSSVGVRPLPRTWERVAASRSSPSRWKSTLPGVLRCLRRRRAAHRRRGLHGGACRGTLLPRLPAALKAAKVPALCTVCRFFPDIHHKIATVAKTMSGCHCCSDGGRQGRTTRFTCCH